MDAKEEIRSRLNIEDVIGQYVQLKRAGRNFKAISPFSQEKTASFMISPEKNIWHDFSSGKGGDVFSFVMEMEGVDFRGALEILARQANVDLSQYGGSQGSGLGKKKERLLAALELAATYYQQSLLKNKSALDYVVQQRKMNKQVVRDFRIGYAPDSFAAVYDFLQKRGFGQGELRDAGLAAQRRGGVGDMFRARLMVPLMDPQGHVIGFTARILADDPNAPKYINTPQTLLYDKGRHIFGLHLAKEAIRKADFVVVVEGNLDVIASHQAGVTNVVATAGTAMTEQHLKALSRFTQDVRLAFDADKAGIAATERAISLASNLGIVLGIITLPNGAKDPDELIQKDFFQWQQAIDKPQDAVEWLLDVYSSRLDVTTAEGKRKTTDRALAVVGNIADPVLLEHYIGAIAKRTGASVAALQAKLAGSPAQSVPRSKDVTPKKVTGPDRFAYQDHLLALVWHFPQLRDSLARLEPTEFAGTVRQNIAAHVQSEAPLLQSDDIRVKIGELELICEARYPDLRDELYFTAAGIAKRIKKEHKQIQRAALAKQLFALADAEKPARKQLNQAIKQLDKEIEALKH